MRTEVPVARTNGRGPRLPAATRSAWFFIAEIGLDGPVQLDRQRIAVAVLGLAGGHPDPAFADAILFDIGLLDALEADADVAFQHGGVVIGAVRIVGEAVGRCVGHRLRIPYEAAGAARPAGACHDSGGRSPSEARLTPAALRS